MVTAIKGHQLDGFTLLTDRQLIFALPCTDNVAVDIGQ